MGAELGRKLDELARANHDLVNSFSDTDQALLLLDREQRVTRFTPAAEALFGLIEADIGRPLTDTGPRFADHDLVGDVGEVLRTLRPIERQLETIDRRANYLLRVLPNRTVDDMSAGVVVSLTDITEIKRADDRGQPIGASTIERDISEHKQREAERRQLIEELRDAKEQLSAELDAKSRLLAIGAMSVRQGDLEPVLGAILDAAIAIAGADFGNIQLLDRTTGDLKIAVHRGFPAWWVEFFDRVGKGMGACGAALERRESVVVEDVEQSSIFVGTPALDIQRRAGIRAVQSTPLVSQDGDMIGVLSTHYRTPGRPSDRVLQLVDLFARQAADMLCRAQTEAELEAANQRLCEADRRKNEFLGMLSHELRNPLAPIRAGVYILERTAPGDERWRRALAVIDRQVDHMTRLVDELLDITRVTSGKITLDLESVDLNTLVQSTAEDLRQLFVDGGVALEVRPGPAAAPVKGDRTRLAQVFGNLLQNAIKFTPRGGKTTVTLARDEASGQVSVRVQDTGRGMTPDILPRLFEAFTQADTTLDRSKGGLGLGLALVKGMVEMHGGSATASSGGLGQGSTFTITLPLAAAGPVAAGDGQAGKGQARSSRRVLVIEDNLDAGESLHAALKLDGHAVAVARSGPEGIEQARVFKPDVVLCDIGLPEMDGYEVARRFRADPALRTVRLVALSGYARPEDVARAREAGFDTHLAKPPDFAALERALASDGMLPDVKLTDIHTI